MLVVANRGHGRAGGTDRRRPRLGAGFFLRPLPAALAGRAGAILAHDTLMAGLAAAAALHLRLGHDVLGAAAHRGGLAFVVAAFAALALAGFLALGVHLRPWRYLSLADLRSIQLAATAAAIGLAVALAAVDALAAIPRSVPAIAWFVLVALLVGSRLSYRWLRGRARRRRAAPTRPIPVLLLGAGRDAELFIEAIEAEPVPLYRVVGVLDDTGELAGRTVRGVPVLGRTDELEAVCRRLAARGERPQRLVLGEAGGGRPELLERARALGLTAARLPRPTELREATAAAQGGGRLDLRPVALEDLLGRPQVALDRAAIGRLIAGRRVLVTGAGGTIGGELCRQIVALRPAALVLLDHSEFNLYRIELELREDASPGVAVEALLGDVRDAERVARAFAAHRPELVFHAAGLKHVPLVEANPAEGALTNVVGTRVVADAARAHRALAFVQVSTDKAVNPTSVMGATKRIAESYCQALDLAAGAAWGDSEGDGAGGTRFMTVRFGNVIGSSGSVVPLFQRQLARGGPLTVTHPEMRRYFMTTGEAVELVLQASAHGLARPDERGRIFVLDMGEPVRIVDVARQMIRLAGLEPGVDVRIEFVGLRPGERLYEELFHADEVPVPTDAKGVLAARPRPTALPALATALDRLAAAARCDDAPAVRRLLAGLVEGLARGAAAGASGGDGDALGPGWPVEPPPPAGGSVPIDLAAAREAAHRRRVAVAVGA